jgi:tyrosine-protein phosphatase SIW14
MNKLGVNFNSVFLVALMAFCSAAATAQVGDEKFQDIGIINFHQVNPHLFRGSRLQSQDDAQTLSRLGIKMVIDLQGGDADGPIVQYVVPYFEAGETQEEIALERSWVEATGIKFYSRPLGSLWKVSDGDSKRIDEVLALINNPANQPVYVHCAHGADRTGLVVALERVRFEGWKPIDAYDEMEANGHNLLHFAFTGELDEYFLQQVQKLYESSPP